jgi:hypothetical protein
MKEIVSRLNKIIDTYSTKLNSISDQAFESKPLPDKWSKKEILGHLVDSAQNNIRRFIVVQYENSPLIDYQQNQWVSLGHYQEYDQKNMIQLWVLLNKHICHILGYIIPEMYMRNCRTGSPEEHNLQWLAHDYVRHLIHHLNQIVPPDEAM